MPRGASGAGGPPISSRTVPSGAMRRRVDADDHAGWISMRALVPRIDAVFDPAALDEEKLVETAPPSWTMTVATSASAPVSPGLRF
ncbi:hypothetical protein D3C73_1581040 [compost metagenome]